MLKLDRRAVIASLGGAAAVAAMSPEAKADALEGHMTDKLQGQPAAKFPTVGELDKQIPTRNYRRGIGDLFGGQEGNVASLPPMPEKPTLHDFINLRFQRTLNHCLQSANHARSTGMDDEIVFACLIHDLPQSLMRAHHGFWGGALYEPYVSERVTFAVRHHASLRFFPDEKAGYSYPDLYRRIFGEDYVPPPHVQREYQTVLKHPLYEAARQVTVHDLYAFDPKVKVSLADFDGLIDKHFRQPKEGLGFDDSPSAHMWRTIAFPDTAL